MQRFLALVLWLTLAPAALAQDRATLVADSLVLAGDQVLIAEGGVEVFYDGQSLTASRLVYDGGAGTLTIEGPIRIDDGRGNVLLADQASLSDDLTEGILQSARLELASRLQLAAAVVERREGGRVTALARVAASSCRVCPGGPPLWEIRARSVLHDAEAQRLYFDNPTLRFSGVPVLWLPRLSMPDPTVSRSSGVLVPVLTSSTDLGFGLELPFFLTLGPSADLTFTPHITSKHRNSLGLRFRQALDFGEYSVTGAVTDDGRTETDFRGYATAEGSFDLGRGYVLRFEGTVVSDAEYLADYDLSDVDRLESSIGIERTRVADRLVAEAIGFQSLREGEGDGTQPVAVTDLVYDRRFHPPLLGGTLALTVDLHGHYRPKGSANDLNGDGIPDGRDLTSLSLTADWQRRWIAEPLGIDFGVKARLSGDFYAIRQDTTFAGDHWRPDGTLAFDARWPFLRQGAEGGRQMIEPIAQIVFAPPLSDTIPNDDSTLVEFDEANLFSLTRYPGSDAVEGGTFVNLGATGTWDSPQGWAAGVTAGRVMRISGASPFDDGTGLDGPSSDWLLAAWWQGQGIQAGGRTILTPGGDAVRSDLELSWQGDTLGLGLGLTDLVAAPAEGRADDLSELRLSGAYALTPNWTLSGDARQDLILQGPSRAGLGLAFLNECLSVDLSVSRRFATSSSIEAATDYGLKVELLGFGGGAAGPARTCRN